MYEDLHIIVWPDPRLKKMSTPVQRFEPSLKELAARMFELMREHKGVGLAAPQVGLNIRLFVMNATGEPGDDRVYVNPVLTDPEGSESAEEGCLSLPDIRAKIDRDRTLRIKAQDLDGNVFEQTDCDFVARVWQHETDHLNGTLITDRMGPAQRLLHRKKLKELEANFAPTPRKK